MMNHILVPTDFSACSSYACDAALDMAAYYDAKIHFFHNVDLPKRMDVEETWKDEDVKQYIHGVEALFTEWEKKARDRGIRYESKWKIGDLVENIQQIVLEQKIDFMFMGSHGASGIQEFMMGSNAQKVVREITCPIFIVKENVQNVEFKKVVFASGFGKEEMTAFKFMMEFIKPFDPEVHLLSVNTTSWFAQPYPLVKALMDDFEQLNPKLKCHKHFKKDWTVEGGIRHFIEETGADLVVMSNQRRSKLRRLIVGSNVESLVNHSPVPVLAINLPQDSPFLAGDIQEEIMQ